MSQRRLRSHSKANRRAAMFSEDDRALVEETKQAKAVGDDGDPYVGDMTYSSMVDHVFFNLDGNYEHSCGQPNIKYDKSTKTLSLVLSVMGKHKKIVYKGIEFKGNGNTLEMKWKNEPLYNEIKQTPRSKTKYKHTWGFVHTITTANHGLPADPNSRYTLRNGSPTRFDTYLNMFYYMKLNDQKMYVDPDLKQKLLAATEGFSDKISAGDIGMLLVYSVHLFLLENKEEAATLGLRGDRSRNTPESQIRLEDWWTAHGQTSQTKYEKSGLHKDKHGFYTRYGFKNPDLTYKSSKTATLNKNFCVNDILPFFCANTAKLDLMQNMFTDLTV